jgi:hypothetical protein
MSPVRITSTPRGLASLWIAVLLAFAAIIALASLYVAPFAFDRPPQRRTNLVTRNHAHGPTDVVSTPIWLTMGADTGPFGELSIRQLNWELGSGHARHQGT